MADKKVKYLGNHDNDVPFGTLGIFKRRSFGEAGYVYFENGRKVCNLENLEFIKE